MGLSWVELGFCLSWAGLGWVWLGVRQYRWMGGLGLLSTGHHSSFVVWGWGLGWGWGREALVLFSVFVIHVVWYHSAPKCSGRLCTFNGGPKVLTIPDRMISGCRKESTIGLEIPVPAFDFC